MTLYLTSALVVCILSAISTMTIILKTDPEQAPWYIFATLAISIFSFALTFCGLFFYFLRTKVHGKAYLNKLWFLKTSFKLAFFISLFTTLAISLSFLKIASTFNIAAVFLAVGLLAIWVYLGKREKKL